ncbi:hypothetical protein JCM33374_g1582 [Metschnikowia sp. JCM 33374]|nr:hypothetical protein JCM33374_g1582 [Metschnikowia sp. JCM 33374]
MAVRKPLTKFTTPLGSGAGVAKENRPPRIKDSDTRLAKPFRVPFANKKAGSLTQNGPSRLPDRKAKGGMKNYADGEGIEADENTPGDQYNIDENGDPIKPKKRGALLPRAMLHGNALVKNETAFRKSFTVPFAKTDPKREFMANALPPPPLGTRKKVVLPPRPLHDPTSEFAIVLYDPTVDRFPVLEDSQSTQSSTTESEDTIVIRGSSEEPELLESV